MSRQPARTPVIFRLLPMGNVVMFVHPAAVAAIREEGGFAEKASVEEFTTVRDHLYCSRQGAFFPACLYRHHVVMPRHAARRLTAMLVLNKASGVPGLLMYAGPAMPSKSACRAGAQAQQGREGHAASGAPCPPNVACSVGGVGVGDERWEGGNVVNAGPPPHHVCSQCLALLSPLHQMPSFHHQQTACLLTEGNRWEGFFLPMCDRCVCRDRGRWGQACRWGMQQVLHAKSSAGSKVARA